MSLGIVFLRLPQKYVERKLLWNDPKLQHAFELFMAGHSDKDVEKLVGINARTFRRYRDKYGIFREKNTFRCLLMLV